MSHDTANPTDADVFISYAQDEDGEQALQLADELEAEGTKVWVAERSIEGAQNYGPEVVAALERCKVFVLLCSLASVHSQHVAVEVQLAFESGRPILPLRLDDTPFPDRLRYWLTGWNWIDVSGPPSAWLPRVLRVLQRLGVSRDGAHDIARPTGATARRATPSLEIRYAKSDDVNIAYQVFGVDSPDLLAFSSAVLPIDGMHDEPSLASFDERLASFSRVIRFDRRGVGMSDPIALDNPPTLEQWVHDAVAVLDAAGSDRAALFAPRDSSLQAILLAATYPDRVTSLVIVNGTARTAQAEDYSFGVPQRLLDSFLAVNMEPDAVERGFDYLALAAPGVAGDSAFRAWWNRAGQRGASPAAARAIQAVYLQADVRPLLPMVQAPTLVIHRRDNASIRVGHGRYLAEHIPGAKYLELPGADDLYWVGQTDAMLDEIEEFLTGARRAPDPDRILATVLFTDIVDSTRQLAALGDSRWRDLLDRHDGMVRQHLRRFRGQEIKTTGDCILATFDGPARAVTCACAIRSSAAQLGLEVRAGVHTGEIEVRGDDIGGMAVHIASRVQALAEPSEVLVSRTVVDLIVGSGIATTDRGEHALRGVPGNWRLFAVEG
jgi:class 3 adenylate cyclase